MDYFLNDRYDDYYSDWDPPSPQLIAYRSVNPIYQELPDNYSDYIIPTLLENIQLDYSDYNCTRCMHYILGRCLIKECRTNKAAICMEFELEPPRAEQIYDMRFDKNDRYEKEVLLLDQFFGSYFPKNATHGTKAQICTFIGLNHFSLLRIFFQPSINVTIDREIELDSVKMNIIHVQKQKYHQISIRGKNRLKEIIHTIVKEKEELYKFFNTSRSIKTDLHQLKLLPGLTPQMRFKIIEERKNERFTDFKDVSNRVKKDVSSIIAARILKELQGYTSYYLFSIPTLQRSHRRR